MARWQGAGRWLHSQRDALHKRGQVLWHTLNLKRGYDQFFQEIISLRPNEALYIKSEKTLLCCKLICLQFSLVRLEILFLDKWRGKFVTFVV